MSESLNHLFNRFHQTADSFRKKAFDCVNEWITESFISIDSIKRLIHSGRKHLTALMSESLNHFYQPIHSNGWFIQEQSIWLLMSESLNHLFNRFHQTADSFRKKAFDCVNEWITESFLSTDSFKRLIHSGTKHLTVNEWITESFIQPIPSNGWFIQEQSIWLLMSEALNHLFNRFHQTADSFRNKAFDCVNEWITESFIQPIPSNGWFIQEQSIWLC